MTRAAILILCFTTLASARADDVRGRVTLEAGQVQVGGQAVGGPLARTLALFEGREVVVEGTRSHVSARWHAERIVRPERVELRGHRDGAALVTADRGRVRLLGPAADLLPEGRVCVVDAYLFGAQALAVAVEGRTTRQWNLVHLLRRWGSPVDVIRGARPVWIVGRGDGRWLVRRGDTQGWVADGHVVVGEEPAPGLIDALPR